MYNEDTCKLPASHEGGIGEQATKPGITELETYTIDASNGKWIDVDYRAAWGKARLQSDRSAFSHRRWKSSIDVGTLVTSVSRRQIDITGLRIHRPEHNARPELIVTCLHDTASDAWPQRIILLRFRDRVARPSFASSRG